MRHGIALVTEDRKGLGLFADLSVAENITLCHLDRLRSLGMLSLRRERETARDAIVRFGIKTANLAAPILSLSGGNQQKCILARWLLTNPRILLLDEPTRGVDVGAKAEIYRLLRELAGQGMGIIMTSSELPELLTVCDRIMVLCEGRKTAEFDAEDGDGRESPPRRHGFVSPPRSRNWEQQVWSGAPFRIGRAGGRDLRQVGGHRFLNYDDDHCVTNNSAVLDGLSVGRGLGSDDAAFFQLAADDLAVRTNSASRHSARIPPGITCSTSFCTSGRRSCCSKHGFRLTGNRMCSWLVAALYTVHPLHVESVAWVAERKGVLANVFAAATLWAYAEYGRRPSRARYFLVAACFGLGLMSKQTLVTLPLALLLLDWWPLGRWVKQWKLCLLEKLPLLALAVLASIAVLVAERRGQSLLETSDLTAIDRSANALHSVGQYLRQTVWPTGLAPWYPHWESGRATDDDARRLWRGCRLASR